MAHARFMQWQIYDESGRRKYLSEGELKKFLQQTNQLTTPKRALCHTLVFTGCRISEALALEQHHLDTERLTLTIRTLKRRRTIFRVVPIPVYLANALDALPATKNGRFWCMHRSSAWRVVKQVMTAADIAGPMACGRGLRHAFGMRAAQCNVPQNLIQRFMGHASPSTTAVYLDAVGLEERAFAERMW